MDGGRAMENPSQSARQLNVRAQQFRCDFLARSLLNYFYSTLNLVQTIVGLPGSQAVARRYGTPFANTNAAPWCQQVLRVDRLHAGQCRSHPQDATDSGKGLHLPSLIG